MMHKWISVMLVPLLVACSCSKNIYLYPGLMEAEKNQTTNCRLLASVVETADPGAIISYFETKRCINKVIHQAVRLNGTHLVWLYKNKTGAAAMVYQCKFK